jgi:outer membrane protein assembly factor BamB
MWKLHALDLGTGKLLPSFKPDRTYRMTDCGRIEGVAVYRNVVATTNAKDESFGGAYTLDANTGRVLYKIKNAYSFGAPAFSKKWAFFPSSWRGVAVLDLEANKRHSNKAQYGSSVLETPLAAVNLMILATKDGSIEARSIYSGDKDHPAKQVWQWKPPGKTKFDTAPAAADGFIVVGCDDGYIYGFSYNKE